MKRALTTILGLSCLLARGASAQTFEQQLAAISRAVATPNPADALDENIAGAAAKFVAIAPGEFDMGSPADEGARIENEVPHHIVLTKAFELQATAVTQIQYFLVTGLSPSSFWFAKYCDPGSARLVYGRRLCADHPVENVSWIDAQKFIAQLNTIQNTYTYRLPTEAEREYAARGGRPSSFPFAIDITGGQVLDDYAWYHDNSNGRTHAVATRKESPGAFRGLYDMNGNVWEWVSDWYGPYRTAAQVDPQGPPSGMERVLRGGSWIDGPWSLRSADRGYREAAYRNYYVGFRLARVKR